MCDDSTLNESLEFFGRITASVSHELNNVMSIIDQTSGLLDDLLFAAEQGQSIPVDRLKTIYEKLSVQTDRGVRIIKRLNSFAHSVDDPLKEVELNQLVDTFARLMQRLTGLKKVDLVVEKHPLPLKAETNPFVLQMIFYTLIQGSLNDNAVGGNLCLRVYEDGGKPIVEVQRIGGESGIDKALLDRLSKRAQVKICVESRGGQEYHKIALLGI